MLKMRKLFSAFVGAVMTANVFMTMPFSAFAEEETSHTYTYDGYEVSYDVTNSWGNTEVVSVTLSNIGDNIIENWMLYFEPNGQVHDPVHAVEKQTSTGISYFQNSGYNANVAPDSSVSFSYMVDDCESIPDSFTLCQTRVEKESGYQVSLKVNQTWGDSFNGEIIIHNNTDKPIEAWELIVDTNFTITEITNSWAATVTELDSYSYMLKGTYTGTVYANSSVSLGFNGVKSGEPIISDYSLTEVVVDEEKISSSESNNQISCDGYVNNYISAEASYNSENENIDISWTASAIGSSFEVYVSDDNKNYELYETVDGNTFNSAYHTSGDFFIRYFKIKQNLYDGGTIYSNICYAVFSPEGIEWEEYLHKCVISDNDELLSGINTDDAPYKLSVEFEAAGVPEIHMIASESSYTNAINNDYILGASPELIYKEGLSIKDIKIKFEISDEYLNNELGTLENNPEFSGIKRFNIFKYFEDINMLLPIETKFDKDNNKILYTEVDELGTYCIVDMEKWLQSLDIDDESLNKLSLDSTAGYSLYDNSETAEVSEEPVDIVFVWQMEGSYQTYYNSQKQTLIDLSEKVFNTYPNARIYIIGFERDGEENSDQEIINGKADFLKNKGSEAIYFSSDNRIKDLDGYEYKYFEKYGKYVDRSPAYDMVLNDIKFREDAKKFAFTIFNGNTKCKGTDQIDICNSLDINYSEVMTEGIAYTTAERTVNVMDAIIKSEGIYFVCNDNAAQPIYEHIHNKITKTEPDKYDTVYIGTNWSEVTEQFFNNINNDSDYDGDDLIDWDEINSDILKKTGITTGGTIDESQLPFAWDTLKTKYSYVPFRYVNSNNLEVLSILNKVIFLPVISNPLEKSSAFDGINDFDKMKVGCICYLSNNECTCCLSNNECACNLSNNECACNLSNNECTFNDSNQSESNESDESKPKNIFEKYVSVLYSPGDPNYNHYNDSDYYFKRLDDRYKIKKPFKSYTIETLFPEFKNKTINNELNSVYLKVDGNEITICPTVYFKEDYDKNASEYLSDYIGDEQLYQVFIDGIQEHWGKPFEGTIFDFYPGMIIEARVDVKPYNQDIRNNEDEPIPQEQKYITVNMNYGDIVGVTAMGGPQGNSTISLMTNNETQTDNFKKVCSHEFGHALNLYDSYSSMNSQFTAAYNSNNRNEIDSVDIMSASTNSDETIYVMPNNIEMVLYGIMENSPQCFTPTYYDKYDCTISKALREKPAYQYGHNDYKPEYDTVYQLNTDYKWVDGKGYIPLDAKIDDDNKSGLQYYEETYNGNTTVTIYGLSDSDYSGNVIIPEKIGEFDVTKICDGAFRDSDISSITFKKPENIVGIGMAAFYNCAYLSEITIPSNIEIILPNTFNKCINLIEVEIPVNEYDITNVSVIDGWAFGNCENLTNLTIPNGVRYIGLYSFNYCHNIGNIVIPASVKKIDEYAFNMCWLNDKGDDNGSIKFNRTENIDYDKHLLYNDPWVTIYVPEKAEAKEMYEKCFALFRSYYHDHEIELKTFKIDEE